MTPGTVCDDGTLGCGVTKRVCLRRRAYLDASARVGGQRVAEAVAAGGGGAANGAAALTGEAAAAEAQVRVRGVGG